VPNVQVIYGPSQSFNALLDRVPVAGDTIIDPNIGSVYIVGEVQLLPGGGSNAFVKVQGDEEAEES
jgi:hypothetical protein